MTTCLTRPTAPRGVLRRIEHAARNTAAAPFWRRSSLERTCTIRILLLNIGLFWNRVWNHFGWLLGSLGHHFGSFGESFWEPKSLILAPWGALGAQTGPNQKCCPKRRENPHRTTSILGTILVSFFTDFSVYFSVRFLDHFWRDFGAILGPKM